MENIKIAVVGLGPAGLTALKFLREEGFDAVAFERREKIGGLWSYSENATYTSALKETVCNVSKFVWGFSDYPLSTKSLPYPTSSQVAAYFNSYASHFNLQDHVRFNTTVRKVTRNAADTAWDVHITNPDGDAVLSFDKVVFCQGAETTPSWPSLPNRDKFKGVVIHSQAYKNPEPFKGKKVLVVGIGNTACDISLALRNHTAKLYQSYRRGKIMVSRTSDNGIPFDAQYSWPEVRLKYCLDSKLPWLMWPVTNKIMTNKMINDTARFGPELPGMSRNEKLKYAERKLREDWRLLPHPSMAHVHPGAQEEFIPALYEEEIIPVKGFKSFTADKEVLLEDGTKLEVDVVIFCTGYKLDFSIMPEMEMDGAAGLPLKKAVEEPLVKMDGGDETAGENQGSQKPHLPRLFQMIFPPRWASSIAFMNWMSPQEPVWSVRELASMAVSQIWAAETAKAAGEPVRTDGYRSPALLPSLDKMNAEVDAYQNWWRGEWEKERSLSSGYLRAHSFYRFLHDAAGTGLYDNIDHMFTGRGWGLWWNDRELWTLLAKGPMNCYSWRLFETNPDGVPGCGRKIWPGARKAMQEVYENYEEFKHQAEARYKENGNQVKNN
ncbi:FAD/NAD(P)-binding domain-containing protein [Hypoxylon trugodes]|uniref:FAD/NAD(P)-binding domain-containing protein n=1 Tax=Hypoxylon trugodes TaxID=326681 RepID=UPI00219C7DC9|nr:FAD/NAD(P)-binding domain-containing protein [Hypoxylon trugodes]KAI1393138.1 FAD/NAD(P)-binding domain-containing protein [Hypoxylon trugodes]